MTYLDLNIHQRINVKHNETVYTYSKPPFVYRKRNNPQWGELFAMICYRMVLKSERQDKD
jgi:hypothetical protein